MCPIYLENEEGYEHKKQNMETVGVNGQCQSTDKDNVGVKKTYPPTFTETQAVEQNNVHDSYQINLRTQRAQQVSYVEKICIEKRRKPCCLRTEEKEKNPFDKIAVENDHYKHAGGQEHIAKRH
jgi:hypothetical protein